MKSNILITHQIHYLARILERNADTILKQNFDVDFIDFLIFHALLEVGTLTQNDIANSMGYTKSLVSKRMSAFLKNGWVQQQVNSADRRENFVTLTESGREFVSNMNAHLEQQFLNLFTAEDLNLGLFSQSLNRITNKLEPTHT